jgi:hypothetical protein
VHEAYEPNAFIDFLDAEPSTQAETINADILAFLKA